MKFILEVLPRDEMRYPTVGDWFEDSDGTVHIQVADTVNLNYAYLVMVHELVEYWLCRQRGISEASVSAFDLSHGDSDEPGDEPDAPYRNEHCVATGIERILASELNVAWLTYDDVLDKIYKELWRKHRAAQRRAAPRKD
jgi:hypothetical protein